MASFTSPLTDLTRPLPVATWLDLLRDYETTLPMHMMPHAYNRALAFQEWVLVRYSPLDRFTAQEFNAVLHEFLEGLEPKEPQPTPRDPDPATPPPPAPPRNVPLGSLSGYSFSLYDLYVRALAVAFIGYVVYSSLTAGG